jgi:hypothetical protein
MTSKSGRCSVLILVLPLRSDPATPRRDTAPTLRID